MINTKRLAVSLLGTVRAWVEPAFKDIHDRLDGFDARLKAMPAGPAGKDGAPADPALIRAEVERAVAALPIPAGLPGKDAEPIHPDTVARMVFEEVDRRIAALPTPADGKDADPAFVSSLVAAEVGRVVAALPPAQPGPPGEPGEAGQPGANGQDVDMALMREMVAEEASRQVAQIPRPKDGDPGKDVDQAALEARLAAAEERLQDYFAEMGAELLSGLDDEAAALPSPAMSINVHVPGGEPIKSRGATNGTREMTVLMEGVVRTVRDTLMLPVVPVYDDKGRLLYGQRMDPNAPTAGNA